jgi:hypothetical protein
LLSPALRKDLLEFCYPPQTKSDELQGKKPKLNAVFTYFVILEANENPYAVQERIEKSILDEAFASCNAYFTHQNSTNTNGDNQTWRRIAFHYAKYF